MPNKKRKGFRRFRPSAKELYQAKVCKCWSDDQMAAAIKSVVKDGLSGNHAADLHGVP